MAPMSSPLPRALAAVACVLGLANPAFSQDRVAVSVKHVWGPGPIPARSLGPFTFDGQIEQVFKEVNDLLGRKGVSWRLALDEIVDIRDMPEYFDIDLNDQRDEVGEMEDAALANPARFAWRTDAINVYIVGQVEGPVTGVCSFPHDPRHEEIVIIQNEVLDVLGNLSATWLHEFGHYFDLRHTFECGTGNCDPEVCTNASGQCDDICPDDRNIMSYDHLFVFFQIPAEITPCQIDIMTSELYGPLASRTHVLRACGDFCAGETEECTTKCNSDESGCLAPCRVAGGVCRDACGLTATGCRGACDGVRAVCRLGCEIVCLFPDSAACRDCRSACDAAGSDCRGVCDGAESGCKSGCDGIEDGCEGLCNNVAAGCRQTCGDLDRTCNGGCAAAFTPSPPTATPVPTRTPIPTVSGCAGDCNGDGRVRINEMILSVNIGLDRTSVDQCDAVDTNANGQVAINEVIAAVQSSLTGCADS
jgi:hypothetical protein